MTTEERIAKLEAQIEKLEAKQTELRQQLVKAEIDQWQGRIDDLEVQAHLGAMEVNDRVNAGVEQLRARWTDTRRQVEHAAATASDVADTLREGVASAVKDLQKALIDSKKKVAP